MNPVATRTLADERSLLIAGGGPAGSCLACLLADQGWPVHLLEARAADAPLAGDRDLRTLALALPSWELLAGLGITPTSLGARPIRRIHVSYRGRPGRVLLDAGESAQSEFGWTVRYGALLGAIHAALQARAGIRLESGCRVERVDASASAARVAWRRLDGTTSSRLTPLALVADGGGQPTAPAAAAALGWRYGQQALTCQVSCDRPTGDLAWERFTAEGPVALLPGENGYSLIWTGPARRIRALLALDDREFLARLQDWFGDRAGRFVAASPRRDHPLQARFVLRPVQRRVILLGNAAQSLHPVAGQGFNLALRDVRVLAETLGRCLGQDPGLPGGLSRYADARRHDRGLTAATTHLLAGIFSLPLPGLGSAGSLALTMLDSSLALRRRFAGLMGEGIAG